MSQTKGLLYIVSKKTNEGRGLSMTEIDHDYTSEIVCPYCGHTFSDSWEMHGDDGETECDECNKVFMWRRDVSVTYVTEKDCLRNKQEHKWEDRIDKERGYTYKVCVVCGDLNFPDIKKREER